MPNASGVWTLSQQFQARGQGLWPNLPNAPTIGTATLVTPTSATVAFTAPTCTGTPAGITGYRAISTPGCITATGASSPLTVTGLTSGVAYTFQVQAQNASGYGSYSASSNSVQAKVPGAPTIGTASVSTATSASVAFTPPACVGSPGSLTYTATSTPGCITGTGSSSPVTVSGLTTGTSYTFKVKAQNLTGTGPCSAASNSVTPEVTGQQAYTTPGTYSWVAPTGVTSVSAVVVGGGGGGSNCNGAGGGALAYKNNISVTPGNSYTVVVGAGGAGSKTSYNAGGYSGFINDSTLRANGGDRFCGGSVVAGTGGKGGRNINAGGGAGGYSGPGGFTSGIGTSGSGGAGGMGGQGREGTDCTYTCGGYSYWPSAGGGGVGILGEGASGAGGANQPPGGVAYGGCGGSGGATGSNGSSASAGNGGNGGAYGGGGGRGGAAYGPCFTPTYATGNGGSGAGGAVRIIWPGTSRSFPSTNTGNL